MAVYFFIFSLLFLGTPAFSTDLPIRGIARGESKIKVGDKAPLLIPDLEKAHADGKAIILMMGYPSHCNWCDKMDRYIRTLMSDTDNFAGKAAFIMVQIGQTKMIQPPEEGIKLKEAYGVDGQPWLFIIDKTGTVRYIHKMFVSSETLKKEIEELSEKY